MQIRKQQPRRTFPTRPQHLFTEPHDVFLYGAFLPRTLTNLP